MKVFRISLFLFLAVCMALSAAETFGNPQAPHTVLIALENTRYKDRLVDTLVKKLDDGSVYITVVDHKRKELEGRDPRDYKAVFITNSGVQAKVRPWVLDWLDSVAAYDDNVLIHTTQITEWDPPVQVDSITSASKNSNIDDVTDDIVRRLRALFQ
ncbi:hypothetical protein [Marispirochaeta aestuarii]|uniref:hypothetical protein n=1 Tax=Marispirochaeta aestuarii TaxID=1963862 RepID=UPI0029C67CD5|nr:hypothetical protein [Marispirochaeta aestuarii]